MNPYILYNKQHRGWTPQPDQSGYRPLRRSSRVIDLTLPPKHHTIPASLDTDPDHCHHSLHEHRQTAKQKYRRMVRDQMKAEEALWSYQHRQNLEPFPYGALEMKQPLLPELNVAMHESGGDAVRAWKILDRRSWQEKAAEEAANEKRETEVKKRADEMARNEKEAQEDEVMRQLLEELPTFKCPAMTNTIPFASVIGNIQERIHAHLNDITISLRGNPHRQLELTQVCSWIQQDCNQENLENIFLVSVDELNSYCSLIADYTSHHASADFKKHNYLPQLRHVQARLRNLKQANSELRLENERLRSGVGLNSRLEHNLDREPLFEPSVNPGVGIFNNQVKHRGRVPPFEPLVHRHYSDSPPQLQRSEYRQSQMDWVHRSTPIPFNSLDVAMEYQKNIITESDMSQMNHMMEFSPVRVEETNLDRCDARRAYSMALNNRTRTKAKDPHAPLPERDPVTGYGTVVTVDEISPIYDYPELHKVYMRGGAGPYSLLEDSDTDGDEKSDGKATDSSNITSGLGKGTFHKMKRLMDDDGDDDKHDDSFFAPNNLKFTKRGDTMSNGPNNQLWGTGPPSSSGIGRSSATIDNPANTANRRNHHNKGRRRRNGPRTTAPGLAPFTPKVDPYAEVPHGFQFSWNQAENVPLKNTWATLDPTTGTVKYEEGDEEGQEENQPRSYMWNPSDPKNTPLAATMGTSNVMYAEKTKEKSVPESVRLTAESLQRLDRQSRQDEPIDDYIDITSTPGSPDAPPSEPSVVEYHPALKQDSIVTETVDKQYSRIDADARKNFMDNINAMHDARSAPGVFERRNQGQGWMAKTKAPISYINEFGEGNVVEVKMKTETRTRMMNDKGGYDGKDLGKVKKRYVRGLLEMVKARDDELIRASKEYREWQAMSLEGRMERLTLIRQPIDLWEGKPGADQNDQQELQYLPEFYSRRVSRRKEKQRMRAMLAKKAKQKKIDDASASLGTTGTGDTLDTYGVLGDCDDLPASATSGGSRTPRVGDETLQEMLQRALDLDPSRGSRSRSRSSSKSISVAGSMDAERGFKLPERVHYDHRSKPRPSLYSGGSGTGNSVAGPRQSRQVFTRPSPSPVESPNLWCPSESGSDAPSTVRGLRNEPLDRHIFNGSGTERSSDGTNAVNELAALIAAYDDSPTLMIPTDTDIPSVPLTEEGMALYSCAVEQMENRGRVVTVRLHAVQESHSAPGDVLPRFTPGTIANKVFGGVVQEFQLHPEKRMAVVVFMFPREARSFVHHVRNVREKGTGHDIRELQIEASWFRGIEAQAILPAQPNLLKHSITSARRCMLLSHIPKEKANRVVFQELSAAFGTILVGTLLITPQQNYILQSKGKQALVEFANFQDALRAFDDLNAGLIAGYESANPRFTTEPEEKRSIPREYCGCLGCEEKRGTKTKDKEEKKRKQDEMMRVDDYEMTSYSDTAEDE